MSEDILIIGAGLSGLHVALQLSKNPKYRITIAEKYNYIGGRVVTYHSKIPANTHWENGAGRIAMSHTLVRNYVKHYGLTMIPIDSDQVWRTEGKEYPDSWPAISTLIDSSLSSLSPAALATHTIQELLEIVGDPSILLTFPYRSEITTLRADLALDAFKKEMNPHTKFFIVAEGLDTLIKGMKKELDSRGVKFLMKHSLQGIEGTTCTFEGGKILSADKLILAIHSKALKQIPSFTGNKILKHLEMTPLLRIYAVFPTDGKSWFSHLKKTVTDSPIRYIIPINSKKGIIMISYTDGEDTQKWLHHLEKGEDVLQREIMKELRKLFPMTIPDPIFFKAHPWKDGCTYWLPGLYSPAELSKKIMNPFPDVYVCGESYSMKQAWMEGALEHADEMLNKFLL